MKVNCFNGIIGAVLLGTLLTNVIFADDQLGDDATQERPLPQGAVCRYSVSADFYSNEHVLLRGFEFSPDSKYLLSRESIPADVHLRFTLRDAKTGQRSTINIDDYQTYTVLLPQKNELVFAKQLSETMELEIRDLPTGAIVRETKLKRDRDDLFLQATPDGKSLLWLSSYRFELIDLDTFTTLIRGHVPHWDRGNGGVKNSARPYSMAETGNVIAMVNSESVELFDRKGKAISSVLKDSFQSPVSVTLSADGRRLALLAGSIDHPSEKIDGFVYDRRTLFLMDIASGNVQRIRDVHGNDAVFTRDGKALITFQLHEPWAKYARAEHDNTAFVWDAATGEKLLEVKGPPEPTTAFALLPDEKRFALGDKDGFALFNAKDGRLSSKTSPRVAGLKHLLVSPDGKRILSVSYGDDEYDEAVLWDTAELLK